MSEHATDPTAGELEQFRALRAEIDRRSNSQQAIAGLQLTASATVLGLVASHPAITPVAYALGPVSFFLALAWIDHHRCIDLIGLYIRTRIEDHVPGIGWEKWLAAKGTVSSSARFWRLVAPTVLLFVGPPLAALTWLAIDPRRWPALGVTGWIVDLAVTLCCGAVVALNTVAPKPDRRP